MNPRERVYVAIGSNLGDREAMLARAREGLGRIPLTRILAVSSIEETEPVGPEGQGRYLNQMVLLDTTLDPGRFLKALQKLEDENGRTRGERWGPRTLDLDIVRYGTRRLRDPDLKLPHPEMLNRDWWQREMDELDRLAPPADPDDA
ncbi:MAG: 2-amino-4-hydroxy-6-hydroxymethyldihydropteridine diphosphokinase [Gemmatimonadota bacterium]|nr:2-amino-4-hydroxy-6-hydroxymethyldihydropteridine diphosphokinase [Gemmatimonadota bacterium]MDH5283821.1 2-amino-4-hydroxy-6-hydroxymethyldihydropteridine diphosphokinase [Gemmatimonadota bacterium]